MNRYDDLPPIFYARLYRQAPRVRSETFPKISVRPFLYQAFRIMITPDHKADMNEPVADFTRELVSFLNTQPWSRNARTIQIASRYFPIKKDRVNFCGVNYESPDKPYLFFKNVSSLPSSIIDSSNEAPRQPLERAIYLKDINYDINFKVGCPITTKEILYLVWHGI